VTRGVDVRETTAGGLHGHWRTEPRVPRARAFGELAEPSNGGTGQGRVVFFFFFFFLSQDLVPQQARAKLAARESGILGGRAGGVGLRWEGTGSRDPRPSPSTALGRATAPFLVPPESGHSA